MNRLFRHVLLLLVFAPAALATTDRNCGCAYCKDKPQGEACCCNAPALTPVAEVKRHDLRGVVTAVDVERSTLMVKHEEIPGVMRAMTMLFKVEPEIAKRIKKGDAITGKMSRVGNEWRLEDVRVAKQ